MSQIFIGLVGPIASGKGTVASHLKNQGFKVFSLSDKVREEAIQRGLPLTRENLQDIGDELRRLYGNQILAERVAFDLIGESGPIVIDSIRNPGEIEYLRKHFNIKVLGVDAPVESRIIWYLERARLRGEDDPDMTVFIKASLRDRGVGQNANGQQVDKCLELADTTLFNSGTKKDIEKEINEFLKSEYHFDTEIHRKGKEK
jgi:dephospho-CoA kinase